VADVRKDGFSMQQMESDGVHPNSAGEDKIADAVGPALVEVVEENV
jgi:lysophospholipase L1-like esterase